MLYDDDMNVNEVKIVNTKRNNEETKKRLGKAVNSLQARLSVFLLSGLGCSVRDIDKKFKSCVCSGDR